MSPAAQFASVATITFAILGFAIVAFAGLGVTLLLLLYGFIEVAPSRAVARLDEEDPPVPDAPTPEEALRRDG